MFYIRNYDSFSYLTKLFINTRLRKNEMQIFKLVFAFAAIFLIIPACKTHHFNTPHAPEDLAQPNIIFVITDDQGYADLGHTGNPYVKTPNIDALAAESISLTDFHSGTTCAPTRAMLMTGRWANRTGVWHTIQGRSLLRKEEITFASMFADAGYDTGIFGKWHLGDAYPFRPEDRGFTHTFYHGAGGVGQTPDVWNNDYFTGSYYSNGEIERADGFVTDVFFDKAHDFIRDNAERNKPFFAYISTNAPHSPLLAPPKYLDMYKDLPEKEQAFFGMVTNIDDNIGKTRALLKELGIYENSIFVFMTDNGTALRGRSFYNANMRGRKGSEYEGGHRVPFIIHYPDRNYTQEIKVNTLTHAVDIAPTILELAGIKVPEKIEFDGKSIVDLFDGNTENWPERYVISNTQRVYTPRKWKNSSVMGQDWRLINGKELYYLPDDPAQSHDIADLHPTRVEKMREFYESWWTELEPGYAETAEFILGNSAAIKTTLTAHDWLSPNIPPWNQRYIRQIERFIEDDFSGYWGVNVEQSGDYEIRLFRWPPEALKEINASVVKEQDRPGWGEPFSAYEGVPIQAEYAVFEIDGKELRRFKVDDADISINFTQKLNSGKQSVKAYFILADGRQLGATYATFEKK